MQITCKAGSPFATKSELLVLLHTTGEKLALPDSFAKALKAAKAAGDLPTEVRASCLLYPVGAARQKRLLLLSAGPKTDVNEDGMRRLAAIAVQRAEDLGAATVVLCIAEKLSNSMTPARLGLCLGEGAQMGAYRYAVPKKEKDKPAAVKNCYVMSMGGKAQKAASDGVKRGAGRGASVNFTRSLCNASGNRMTPTLLAKAAKALGNTKVRVRVLDEAQMKREKMGALLGVSRGSSEPAKLIVLDYKPKGAKKTLCVVGKGLTFDAGGISLKPSGTMDEMRYDMCGGGAVLGLFHALSSGAASSKQRIVGIVAASENLPDGDAQKPGDVVTAKNGLTIEILNTDAEGRLILADALTYAVEHYKPQAMVDLATLTGAVIIALGHEVSAAIGNDQKLVDEILERGKSSGDAMWQLPLWCVHKEQMKGKYADLRNINSGKADGGGSIAGAAFLSNFVGDTPWVHLDIAGSAWNAKAKDYYRGGATGVGVRLLIDWVASR